jgi:hypothetical protein
LPTDTNRQEPDTMPVQAVHAITTARQWQRCVLLAKQAGNAHFAAFARRRRSAALNRARYWRATEIVSV